MTDSIRMLPHTQSAWTEPHQLAHINTCLQQSQNIMQNNIYIDLYTHMLRRRAESQVCSKHENISDWCFWCEYMIWLLLFFSVCKTNIQTGRDSALSLIATLKKNEGNNYQLKLSFIINNAVHLVVNFFFC